MIFIKIVIAAVIIIGLAEIAERVNPKIAGLLSGVPIGSALVLFFYGLEYGVDYVQEAIIYNILGLSSALVFISGYYVGSKLSSKYSILSAIVISLFAYAIVSITFSFYIIETTMVPIIILCFVITASHLYFQGIPLHRATKSGKLNSKEMLTRGFGATFLIVIVSLAPEVFGSQAAGVLSAFPAAILSLLIILHKSQGREVVHSVIKFIPIGYVSVALYGFCVGEFYSSYGIYVGTLMGLCVSLFYLALVLLMPMIAVKEYGEKKEA